jgi:hypothetical protein
MSDDHVERNAALLEALVVLDDVAEGVAAKRDLLKHEHPGRRGTSAAEQELVMLVLGARTQEDHAELIVSIGLDQTKHLFVELPHLGQILDVDPDVA